MKGMSKIGYSAFHKRVISQRGQPKKCEVCGTTDENKTYHWANLTGNYSDVADYKRMCLSCHREYDKKNRGGIDWKDPVARKEYRRRYYYAHKDYDGKHYPTHTLYKYERKDTHMKSKSLINFRVPSDTKAKYVEASEVIGISISEICRKALDNAVILAETLKTHKPKEITVIDEAKIEKATLTPAICSHRSD